MKEDENRAIDGKDLRWRFIYDKNLVDMYDEIMEYLDGPCTMLELLIALSFRCEDIMDDTLTGDRTAQWFWSMVTNLGLGSMSDIRFDECYCNEIIDIFNNRQYQPNGKGGLFTLRYYDGDLRKVDIWRQLCWYLDSITQKF
jgi:hypothetical protein